MKQEGIMFLTKRLVLIFFLLIFGIFVYSQAYLILDNFSEIDNLKNKAGNRKSSVDKLGDDRDSDFRFAVIGDTRGFGAGEKLYEEFGRIKPSFVVNLGDIMHSGKKGQLRFFEKEFLQEHGLEFPVFYAVGNHDYDNRFTLSDWESYFGSKNFSFGYKNSLFIILSIPDRRYDTSQTFKFLKEALETERHKYKNAFVFMHRSISKIQGVKGGFVDEDKFIKLVTENKVNIVFSGDYHGFAETKIGDTVFFVTGGGGGRLRDPFMKTHHALIVEAHKERVNVRMVSLNAKDSVIENFELVMLEDFNPIFSEYWYLILAIDMLFLYFLIMQLRRYFFTKLVVMKD